MKQDFPKSKSELKLWNEESVFVFSAGFSELEEKLNALMEALSSEEVARAYRYRTAASYKEFVYSRGFLRQTLSSFLNKAPHEIEIATDNFGKPFLNFQNNDLHFNLSHSGERVVLAIAKGKVVGIDLEKVNLSQDLEVAHQVFSTAELFELNQYHSTTKVRAFFKGWTQKEAFIKALGTGMSYPLKTFSVLLNPDADNQLLSINEDGSRFLDWEMKSIEMGPDYSCSICVQGKNSKIVMCA